MFWPSRSPDLRVFDSFLWGYWKDTVFCKPQNTFSEIDTQIAQAVARIDEHTFKMCTKTWKIVQYLYGEEGMIN